MIWIKARGMSFKLYVLAFYITLTFLAQSVFAQSYGLNFSSHEVVQDRRTALNLTPADPICLQDQSDVSFDFSFVPKQRYYFGYILRLINNNTNIDFVYDAQSSKNQFSIVVGDRQSRITFDVDTAHLYGQWNKIKLSFDRKKDRLTLYCNGKSYQDHHVGLKPGNTCFRILFGAGKSGQFQTTDVPPMQVRDIRIRENGSLKYHWPLNEQDGSVAHEVISQSNGLVTNAVWVAALHQKWQLAAKMTVSGIASIAFDKDNEILYVVASDSLYTYSVATNRLLSGKSHNGQLLELNEGNQSYFNPLAKKVYNILPAQPTVPAYDLVKQHWNEKIKASPLTSHWQFNKMYSINDTSIYAFGGYGHLYYKNDVQRYSFNTGRWIKIKWKGDFFTPRYLSALGATAKGDTAYLLGGYGNPSGNQILNPKNLYDMMRYTVKDHTFKKIYEIKVAGGDFSFANSLIIDPKSQTYYSLVYPEHTYNSRLQLIKGSLSKPTYQLLGSFIPYAFHDTHSFADLYYCPASKRFIAVTLLRSDDNKHTSLKMYSLLCPPMGLIAKSTAVKNNYFWSVTGSVLLILCTAGIVLIYKQRRKKTTPSAQLVLHDRDKNHEDSVEIRYREQTTITEFVPPVPPPADQVIIKNSIFLFGDLQIYDAEGNDITRYFTPMIRELFLIILLYSIRWNRGLSPEKLDEYLWPDKTAKSARNNRSVSLTKLKSLLERINNCNLSKDTGLWMIEINHDKVFVDYYYYYLQLIRNKKNLEIDSIKALIDINRRGNFLSDIEHEWLDSFKSEISNGIVDNFLHVLHKYDYVQDPELLIEIANFIFYFDPVNEDAMTIKCKALSALGKHSIARTTFEKFSKEYKHIYGEDFKRDFHSIAE